MAGAVQDRPRSKEVTGATGSAVVEKRREPPPQKGLVKASFNLPADELEALKALAERRHTSATQVLRDALATESYLQGLVDRGETLIAKIGRRGREIVFSQMLRSA